MTQNTPPRQVGGEIRARRQAAGIKPGRLAELAEVRPVTIYNVEGDQVGASLELLARIAAVLGCTVADLLRDQDAESVAS